MIKGSSCAQVRTDKKLIFLLEEMYFDRKEMDFMNILETSLTSFSCILDYVEQEMEMKEIVDYLKEQ